VDVERTNEPGIDERSRTDERPPVGEAPAAERRRRSKTVLIGLILVSVTLAAVAQLTLKHGMNVVTGNGTEPLSLSDPLATVKRIVLTPSVWIGLMIFAVSAAVWLLVLSRVSLSFAYPFASLTYVLILVFDRFVLHQPISGLRYAGVALVIAGLFLISRTHTVA
jgi:drug/metabolite transporter (DMT)-like permease